MISNLQLTMRKGLLYKATPQTKSKFTGKGSGENLILKEDAECIIATVMEIIAAKRNNSRIVLSDGTEFQVRDYKAVGTGIAKAMNWTGLTYFSSLDDEKPERSFTSWETPNYVQDSCTVTTDNGQVRTIQAEGFVVSPNKLEDLIKDFNKLQGDDKRQITCNAAVNKENTVMTDLQYAYVNGDLRQLSNSEAKIDSCFATLFKPQFRSEFTFGRSGDEEPETRVVEWLW